MMLASHEQATSATPAVPKRKTIAAEVARPVFKLTAIGALILSSPVFAQSFLEEIVVTAQKREQSSQDVGIAISAYNSEQMRAAGFKDSFDVARLSAGVNVSATNVGVTQQFSIRGVTQTSFNDQEEGPNAVYIDEGYLSFGNGQTFGVFDLERAEILKGPQGTLFGRNATGGLVHFITRKPTEETEGYLDFSVGTFNAFNFQGAIGGTIAEGITGRIAVLYDQFEDAYDNEFSGDLPVDGGGEDLLNEESVGFRGHLQFDPSDNFSALLSASYNRTDFSVPAGFNRPTVSVFDDLGRQVDTIVLPRGFTGEGIDTNGNPVNVDAFGIPDGDIVRAASGGLLGTVPIDFSVNDFEDHEGAQDFAFDDINENKNYSFTANLQWHLSDSTSLTWISDYRDFSKDLAVDTDGGPQSLAPAVSATEVDSFSQELRITGGNDQLNWVAGVYYLTIENETAFSLNFPTDGLAQPFAPLIGAAAQFGNPLALQPGISAELGYSNETDTDTASIFGQADFAISENLTLTAGVRVIREEKEFSNLAGGFLSTSVFEVETTNPNNVLPFSTPRDPDGTNVAARTINLDQDETLWSGKLQLDWRPADNVLLYLGINRGVKAGNFNSPIGVLSEEQTPFDEEILLAYEVGFKTEWLDGRLRVNGAAYLYDYEDYQAFLFANLSNFIQNADATFLGFEFETLYSPTPGLEFALNFNIIDAQVEDVAVFDASGLPGNVPDIVDDVDPAFTPEFSGSFIASYRFPKLIAGGHFSVRGDVAYADEQFDNLRNFSTSLLESSTNVNASISWLSEDGVWDASLLVKNVTEETNRTFNADTANLFGTDEFSIVRPRTVTFNVRYSF